MPITLSEVHAILEKTTIRDYIKGFSDATIRNRPILELLRRRGRFLFNQSGLACEWRVKNRERTARTRGDGGELVRDRADVWETLATDWRSFYVGDRITEYERKINDGEQAIIKRLEVIVPDMMKDLETEFCSQIYVDGSATGNENTMEGFMTLYSPAATGTYARDAADLVIIPDGNYAGHDMEPGTDGGNWSSDRSVSPSAAFANDWPYGNGDSLYDWHSPKYVRYKSTTFAGATNTWAANCEKATRMAISTAIRSGGKDGRPDLVLVSSQMLDDFKTALADRLRFDIQVTNNEMADVGFGDGLTFDGAYVTTDFDSPEDYGLVMNLDHMEFRGLSDQLFVMDDPKEDLNNDLLFTGQVWGNFKYDAKFQGFLTPDGP